MSIPRFYISLFTLLILIQCVSMPVTAAYSNPNFTPVINTVNQSIVVYQNQTYTIYDQNYTPFATYMFIALIGLFFLIMSFVMNRNTEIFAALAIIPLAATAWGSLSIDMVLSYGMSGLYVPNIPVNIWMLLENHTVYPSVALGITFLILSVVAIVQFIHELLQGKTMEDKPEEPNED